MDKELFNSKLANLQDYTLEEKQSIMEAKRTYPYCALLQIMDLMSDKAAGIQHWRDRYYPQVALYVPDRDLLMQRLEEVKPMRMQSQAESQTKRHIEDAKSEQFAAKQAEGGDIMKEINAYQEVSFKTAPKSVILSQFLDIGGRNADTPTADHAVPPAETDKKSLRPQDAIETETLAVILEKQGRYDKALAIYEKLIVRNPEKSSTFAAKMESLRAKIDNPTKNR